MGIARSSFSYWRAPAPARPARQAADATLAGRIRKVHQDSDGTYGVPRITWQEGDPDVLVIADAGYDAPRLAFLLKDLPVQVLARMRSDRVLHRAVPPRQPQTMGRPPRHGGEFVFGQPDTWGTPDTETLTDTRLYRTARARSWDRLHPRLTHRSSWATADGTLPVVEGTVIRLDIDHLPSGATPKPVWLWWSGTDATPADADRLWQAYLRRFDIEHTFHLFKQTLGWTSLKIRTPEAADRWTWLILAAYTQLRLARPLAADRRHPGEKPSLPDRLTPARVRRDFRHIHPQTTCPERNPPAPAPDGHRAEEHPAHTPPRRAHTQENTASRTTKEKANHPKAPPHRLKIKLDRHANKIVLPALRAPIQ
ncbi:DDE superfamily endonuclease [Streptomyces sp. 2231.1]|nr:DDE superfamily endonuclease [Streptomyces sp. 2231.1]